MIKQGDGNLFKFQTPEGVKDELFNEYERKQNIVQNINNTFKSFAYREAFTPTIEYYDVFSSIKSTVLKGEMFKLIDKSGDILVLRPDVTIPIARMVANNSKTQKKNFKVFYNHQVFRMDNENRREITQTGIEFFGSDKSSADAEVISIAAKSLLKIDIDFRIEIGHANYYKGLLEEIHIDNTDTYETLKELIENKNFVELKRLTCELDLDERVKKVIVEMPNLYGDFREVLKHAQSLCLNDKMCESLKDLREVCEIIEDLGYGRYISVDLGLINHLDYYSGVIFKGYMASHGEMILSGGRYDDLTENYGKTIPATGFAINIDELLSGIEKQAIPEVETVYIDYRVLYKSAERKTAFKLMEILREKGFVVEGDEFSESLLDLLEDRADAKSEIILDGEEIEFIDKLEKDNINVRLDEFIGALN